MAKISIERSKQFLYISLVFLVATVLSLKLDLGNVYRQGVFLWDSKFTSDLAQNWKNNFSLIPADVPNPFNSRVLFPTTYGAISSFTGISLITSAVVVDVVAILISTFLIFHFMKKKIGISTRSSLVVLVFFLFSYNFPLRQTIFMPGNGWGFPILAVWVSYFSINRCRKFVPLRSFLFFLPFVFIASLIREIYFLLIIHALILKFLILVYKIRGREGEVSKFCINLSAMRLSIYGFVALSIQVYLNSITLRGQNLDGIELLRNYFGRIQQIDLVNILLTFFSTMGVFLVPLIIITSRESLRRSYLTWLRSKEVFPVSLFMVLSNIAMMFYGGSDWPRFATWAFPFYMFFMLGALVVLAEKLDFWNSKRLLALGILIGLLSMRVYLPAGPSLFFPSDNSYCSAAGWKTDYSEKAFRGLSFIKKYRLPTHPVPESDLLSVTGYQAKILTKTWVGHIPEVPYESDRCMDGKQLIYSHAYRAEVNNLPVPFGFQTNQYEYMTLLPFYGNKEIQSIYLLQWVLVYLGVQFRTNRSVVRLGSRLNR